MAAIERNGIRVTPVAAKRPPEGQAENQGHAMECIRQRLLRVRDTAEYLGVSRATVERLVLRGELPIVKIGGSTRYDVEDLDRYIAINHCRNRRRMAWIPFANRERYPFAVYLREFANRTWYQSVAIFRLPVSRDLVTLRDLIERK